MATLTIFNVKNLPGQAIICPIMVGREIPTQALIRLFERARNGQGQIAFISGEAGIGKSRLVRELRTQLSTAQVLQSGCYELDQMQPYAPFVEMLRTLLPASENQPYTPLITELSHLLPGLSVDFAISREKDTDQRRLAQSLTQLFVTMAIRRPLVLIIEDLHWCDDASLDYLCYLSQHLSNKPILLILTWRSDELTHALIHCIATIERTRLTTEFSLERFSRVDLETMVSVIFEQKRPIHADFLEQLHNLTEGNPFFIEEILKSVIAAEGNSKVDRVWDRHVLEQLNIPRTVRASIQQRMEAITAAAKQVLTLAAVIGRQFDFSLLHYLTGQDERELIQCLRELIEAQLVVEEAPDSFVFRHSLTRQAVYVSLLTRERRMLHRTVAEGIEQTYPQIQPDTLLADLAYHCYQGELWSHAINYSTQAGRNAQVLHSPIAAVRHYTTALLASRKSNADISPSLYLARAKMYEMLGEFEAARGDFEQAIDRASKIQDVRAEAQGLLDLGFLWTARDYQRAGEYFQRAATLARGAEDAATLANTLNRIGLWHTHAEYPFEGLRHFEEALILYRQLEDWSGISETLDLLGVTAFMSGDLHKGWRYFEEAIALCRTTGNSPQLATLLLTASIRGGALLVDTLVWMPTPQQECVQQCREAIRLAQEIRLPATEAYARILMAHVLGWQGTFGQALIEADTALTTARGIDHRMWQINAHAILGLLHLELLDYSTALQQLEQILPDIEEMQSLYMFYLVSSIVSRIYIARNQLEQAAQVLNQIITLDLPMQTLAQRLIWTAQAELMLAVQRPEAALGIVDGLIASVSNRTQTTVIPRLWYLRGKVLIALHRKVEAEAILQAGYSTALESGNRPLAWRIGVEMGNFYLAQRKNEEAQDIFDAARTIIRQLTDEIPNGALRDHFLAQAFRTLPRSMLISPQTAVKRDFDGLTKREREVAVLVAQGKTNYAIAEVLTLSERTIEKHVENILRKLNFNTRSQIAVWAVEKQLGS